MLFFSQPEAHTEPSSKTGVPEPEWKPSWFWTSKQQCNMLTHSTHSPEHHFLLETSLVWIISNFWLNISSFWKDVFCPFWKFKNCRAFQYFPSLEVTSDSIYMICFWNFRCCWVSLKIITRLHHFLLLSNVRITEKCFISWDPWVFYLLFAESILITY